MAKVEVTRIFDILTRQEKLYPQNIALAKKRSNGDWVHFSTNEFRKFADQVSNGLIDRGFKKGDRIASISYNHPEWNFVDFGMLQTGIVHVPLYPTLSKRELVYVLNDCGAKAILAETKELAERVLAIKNEVESLQTVFTFDQTGLSDAEYWQALLSENNNQPSKVEELRKDINPEDLATLIYTSGTTGDPKGVMLTHNNLVSNIKATSRIMPVDHNHKVLSFLPLCHVFERMVCYLYMYSGCSVYYAQSVDTIADNLKEVKPHFFTTVPRLLEKVYDKIYQKGLELTDVKRLLFFWALKLGLNYELKGKSLGYKIQLAIANRLVFSKWREALGGNVIGICSGGAALQPRLAKVFWAAQIKVVEGYGLTETSPVIAVNRFERKFFKFGTVGQPIKGVEVEIAEDGEILTRGPHVMKGYFNKPDKTAESIDDRGFFHTGDIGKLDDDNYLTITDRKKEVFKTSGGKYVAPQPIENKFKESPFIEQVMVIGENKKFPAALIVPSFGHLNDWCKKKKISTKSVDELIKNKQVIDRFQREIDRFNPEFSQYEQVKNFALLPNEWSVENNELTHTQKIKRKVILDRYKETWEPLYENIKYEE